MDFWFFYKILYELNKARSNVSDQVAKCPIRGANCFRTASSSVIFLQSILNYKTFNFLTPSLIIRLIQEFLQNFIFCHGLVY